MKRFYVMECWENIQPGLTVNPDTEETFCTDNLQEALDEANDCQEGLVLDLKLMIIIKPIPNTDEL